MEKKHLLSYIGLGLAVAGTAGFIFLYFYPYQSVNFEMITNQAKDISTLNLTSKEINSESKDYERYTSSFSTYLISSNEDYEDLKTKSNIVFTKNYNDKFFETKDMLMVSIKGYFGAYSKATKFKYSNNNINLTIGVEGDLILTKEGSTEDEIYTYYLIPVKNTNNIDLINLTFITI